MARLPECNEFIFQIFTKTLYEALSLVISDAVQFDCSFIDPKGIQVNTCLQQSCELRAVLQTICHYGLPSTTSRFSSASSRKSHIRQSDTIVCRSHPFIHCHLARHLQPILLSFAFDSWAVVCCCIRDLDSCAHIPVPQGSCHRRLVQEIRQCGQNCPKYRRIPRSGDFPGSLQRAEVGQGSSLRFSSYVMHVTICVELEIDFFLFLSGTDTFTRMFASPPFTQLTKRVI